MTRPWIIAHRGGAGLWPENTLFAFSEALRAGYDGIEFDVQLTRDRELVVFHDFVLKRELRRQLPKSLPRVVRELDYAALKALDVGVVKRTRPFRARPGEAMPLLRDVLALVRAAKENFRLLIEIKTAFADSRLSAEPEAVAEAIVAELRRAHCLKNTILVGFDWRGLVHAKSLEPKLPCWFTTMKDMSTQRRNLPWAAGFEPAKFGGSISEAIARAGGDGWLCPSLRATAAAVRDAHEHGLAFGVWTPNSVSAMRRMIERGVDAVCTDRPDRLQTLSAYRPSKSAVER